MLTITKGYKQGRAVMFYDLLDKDGKCTREMVEKAEVVTLCDNGQIDNAKIQWWEGKPIVRCENKQLPLVRVDENGNIIGVATQAVRNGDKQVNKEEPIISVSDKAVTVGKVSNRRPKRNIAYAGYDIKNIIEQRELSKEIDISGLETVGDLFDYIAEDFRVRQSDKYKAEFGKKIKLDKSIKGMNSNQLKAIEYGAATYLMNMVYDEIQQIYMKWS